MENVKTITSATVAVFAMLSQVFALMGYTPPIPLDKMLHMDANQISHLLALVLLFTAPVHQTGWKLVTSIVGFVNARNGRSDADFSKLQADIAVMAKEIAHMKTQQTGRVSFGLLGAIAALCIALAACGTVTADKAAQAKAIVTNACTQLTVTVTTLKALPLSEDGTKSLSDVDTVLTQSCKLADTVSVSSVRDLANTALAPLQSIVKASTLADDQKSRVIVGLGVANVLLNQALTILDSGAAASSASAASE